jgi:hypothetical protein
MLKSLIKSLENKISKPSTSWSLGPSTPGVLPGKMGSGDSDSPQTRIELY